MKMKYLSDTQINTYYINIIYLSIGIWYRTPEPYFCNICHFTAKWWRNGMDNIYLEDSFKNPFKDAMPVSFDQNC